MRVDGQYFLLKNNNRGLLIRHRGRRLRGAFSAHSVTNCRQCR